MPDTNQSIYRQVLVHRWPVKTVAGRRDLNVLPLRLRRASETWGLPGEVNLVALAVDMETQDTSRHRYAAYFMRLIHSFASFAAFCSDSPLKPWTRTSVLWTPMSRVLRQSLSRAQPFRSIARLRNGSPIKTVRHGITMGRDRPYQVALPGSIGGGSVDGGLEVDRIVQAHIPGPSESWCA